MTLSVLFLRRTNLDELLEQSPRINRCNALTWEQKFALDAWCVDHLSLWLDLKIIALTVWQVIKCKGINQPGEATMEEFMGSGG